LSARKTREADFDASHGHSMAAKRRQTAALRIAFVVADSAFNRAQKATVFWVASTLKTYFESTY
jgi:hypothetical protein